MWCYNSNKAALNIETLGESTQLQQKFSGIGENCNFAIAANFYPANYIL